MSVSLDRISVGANESIFVNIQGSAERCLIVQVSRIGRCFVTAPFNSERKNFELTIHGMTEVTEKELNEAVEGVRLF